MTRPRFSVLFDLNAALVFNPALQYSFTVVAKNLPAQVYSSTTESIYRARASEYTVSPGASRSERQTHAPKRHEVFLT